MIALSISWPVAAAAVLAVALALRSAWAILVAVAPLSDSVAYDLLAQTLATHGVYGWAPDQPSAYWPVGTSAIFAASYALFGHDFSPIVTLNVVLGTAIVGQTIWLGRHFHDDTTAIVAGFVMAVWPSQVAYVTVLASELPFTFLVLLGFCAWYGPRWSNSARAVASGLAFAAASYIRPIALLLPVVLWVTALPSLSKLRERLPATVLAMVVIAASIAPWSVRNSKLFDHFVLLSTNGGAVFWMGNNPASDGTYMRIPASMAGLNEYERNKKLSGEAWKYLKEQPFAFLLRSIKKAVLLHLNETIAVHWNWGGIKQRFGEGAALPLKLLMQGYWSLMLVLGLAGLAVLTRERGLLPALLHPIVFTWIYFTAFYAATLVQDRYHFPSHPFIAVLAAIAMRAAAATRGDRA